MQLAARSPSPGRVSITAGALPCVSCPVPAAGTKVGLASLSWARAGGSSRLKTTVPAASSGPAPGAVFSSGFVDFGVALREPQRELGNGDQRRGVLGAGQLLARPGDEHDGALFGPLGVFRRAAGFVGGGPWGRKRVRGHGHRHLLLSQRPPRRLRERNESSPNPAANAPAETKRTKPEKGLGLARRGPRMRRGNHRGRPAGPVALDRARGTNEWVRG